MNWQQKLSFLIPLTLKRKEYFFRSLGFMVVLVGVGALLELLPELQPWSMLAWLTLMIAYRLLGLDIPRAKDIGWSPWALLAYFIPGLGFLVVILLFVIPSGTFPLKRLREAAGQKRIPPLAEEVE